MKLESIFSKVSFLFGKFKVMLICGSSVYPARFELGGGAIYLQGLSLKSSLFFLFFLKKIYVPVTKT